MFTFSATPPMKRSPFLSMIFCGFGLGLIYTWAGMAPSAQESPVKAEAAETTEVSEASLSQSNAPATSSAYTLASLPVTAAKQALLIDVESGAVLFEKNADQLMSPSSMTKIATACFVARKLQTGEITPSTVFTVSKNAYRLEGSTAFLNLGQKVSVQDLLETLIIVSANDSAVTLAEGVCGTEAVFAEALTAFVRSLGATHTTFKNASGLPHPQHKTTARDLACIALHALRNTPTIYPLYSERSLTFNGITQPNKNALLRRDIGCDGIKTGHTNDGGFGIVASCIQGGRRLLLVVNGYSSEQERTNDASALLTWGGKMFENRTLYRAGETIARIPVWYGEESFASVTVEHDVVVTLPKGLSEDARVVLSYDTPLNAPLAKGALAGEIQINAGVLKQPITIPLVAERAIDKAGFMKRVQDAFFYLFVGLKKPEVLSPKSIG